MYHLDIDRRFQRPDVRICVRTTASYTVDNYHLETEAQISNHKLLCRLTYFTLKDYEDERNNMLQHPKIMVNSSHFETYVKRNRSWDRP